MEFFSYYNQYNDLYNIYKEVEFNDIDTEDYENYVVSKEDNLMNVSYKSYGTIDNWWCIYFYNKLNNPFDFLSDEIIFNKIDSIEEDIYNYDTLDTDSKNNIHSILLEYVKNITDDADISVSIKAVNDILESPQFEDIVEFKNYLYDMYIYENNHYKYLKIPSKDVVRKMKQQMNSYNTIWSEL